MGGGLAISDISLLEITVLFQKTRLELNVSLELFLQQIETRFTVARARVLSGFHPATLRHPADRIIGATALVEGIHLIIADQEIRRSKVLRTVW
jgi:PIN domain nuclease of toxin-antitoxin system